MSNYYYTGYGNPHTKKSLNVGKVPGRKSYALYMNGPEFVSYVLAYFKSEEAAKEAIEMFDYIAEAKIIEGV